MLTDFAWTRLSALADAVVAARARRSLSESSRSTASTDARRSGCSGRYTSDCTVAPDSPSRSLATTPGSVSRVNRSTSEVSACSSSRSRTFSVPSSSWTRVLSVRSETVCRSCPSTVVARMCSSLR